MGVRDDTCMGTVAERLVSIASLELMFTTQSGHNRRTRTNKRTKTSPSPTWLSLGCDCYAHLLHPPQLYPLLRFPPIAFNNLEAMILIRSNTFCGRLSRQSLSVPCLHFVSLFIQCYYCRDMSSSPCDEWRQGTACRGTNRPII